MRVLGKALPCHGGGFRCPGDELFKCAPTPAAGNRRELSPAWIASTNDRRPHQALADLCADGGLRQAIAGARAVDM
jgi:hypothetical protein